MILKSHTTLSHNCYSLHTLTKDSGTMQVYRAVIFSITNGQESVALKTEWHSNLEDCFNTASYQQLADHGYYFRRIETKKGQVQYFYQLLDADGSTLKRSDNFEDPMLCLKAAEQEQELSDVQYSIDRIYATNTFCSVSL